MNNQYRNDVITKSIYTVILTISYNYLQIYAKCAIENICKLIMLSHDKINIDVAIICIIQCCWRYHAYVISIWLLDKISLIRISKYNDIMDITFY